MSTILDYSVFPLAALALAPVPSIGLSKTRIT
uniref:Cytochrome b6/f subunit L n=1 Tax=Selaginella kraussiana TaxID=81964 RepID=A0A3Q9R399_9TRAC|nr:cytochrome b6/f subunit L [Selaginella kraussiana]AZU95795.1 cytochrome b6/f subunit L [Selaginella kraussiana]